MWGCRPGTAKGTELEEQLVPLTRHGQPVQYARSSDLGGDLVEVGRAMSPPAQLQEGCRVGTPATARRPDQRWTLPAQAAAPWSGGRLAACFQAKSRLQHRSDRRTRIADGKINVYVKHVRLCQQALDVACIVRAAFPADAGGPSSAGLMLGRSRQHKLLLSDALILLLVLSCRRVTRIKQESDLLCQ
eukprot:s2771_g14.t1